MKPRTWPYGTRKTVTILDVVRTSQRSAVVASEADELYVVLGDVDAAEGVQVGQDRVIEFSECGTSVGKWVVVKN